MELQELSELAYRHACFVGTVFSGNGTPLPAVYEVFPFWTEEEVRAMQVEKYKNIMMQYAAQGGGRNAKANRQGN